eukprot:gnl/TRDRNA2_/TRDRNA2_87347_c0_seq2.p1 gnl/TRDRNA2_/TRDRNA2_87347_c0~~gnl/TRDRNA2_/TRDRNA2_87347_c0_seq2.p1  ORF type:complete len:383 (-),score=55.68 gnl/TRDRNA2_/TRDRNA2_87347_c0_seq2:71-1219(-)
MQVRICWLLVVYTSILAASGDERLAARGTLSELQVRWPHLDMKNLAGFNLGTSGHLWPSLPQAGEVFIQRSHSHQHRYLREPVNVEDMALVYGFPEFVWIVIVAVLVVVVFSLIVVLAMCLARQLRPPDPDGKALISDPEPKAAGRFDENGKGGSHHMHATASPAVPSAAPPAISPRGGSEAMAPTSGAATGQDASMEATTLARPTGPQFAPSQTQQQVQQTRGRSRSRIPMGMSSRTPSEDGLQPRSVAQQGSNATLDTSELPSTMGSQRDSVLMPPSRGTQDMLASSPPLASGRSAQSVPSDSRISDYADQIDRLINELDQEVRKGKPRLPQGLQDAKKGGGKGRSGDPQRSPTVPTISLPAGGSGSVEGTAAPDGTTGQ